MTIVVVITPEVAVEVPYMVMGGVARTDQSTVKRVRMVIVRKEFVSKYRLIVSNNIVCRQDSVFFVRDMATVVRIVLIAREPIAVALGRAGHIDGVYPKGIMAAAISGILILERETLVEHARMALRRDNYPIIKV